jgi:16S rRNA (cytosine1402-N4)-methyltransferase
VPDYVHEPVLLTEVLAGLRPRPGGRYVDGTLGGGSHAAALLGATGPDGWLFGCDRDEDALVAAGRRLAGGYAGRYQLRRLNYAELGGWIEPASCDGVLLDLGVSSVQLDWPERGFSFRGDGPLDMRMDRRQGLTAAEVVNTWPAEHLAQVFWELGEEPGGRRLARAIEHERRKVRFETTRQLAGFIERLSPRAGRRIHPATRVFMALRMVVNDELGSLRRGLEAALGLLRSAGRLAVITFHSVEDRVVKEFGREAARDYAVSGGADIPELRRPVAPRLRWVTRKAIRPAMAEQQTNPRARSAQLRLMESTCHGATAT